MGDSKVRIVTGSWKKYRKDKRRKEIIPRILDDC